MDVGREACQLVVQGVVQGVGFRPFVYRLASELGLAGTVRNDGARVIIDACGARGALDALHTRLLHDAPPLARVERVDVQPRTSDDVVNAGSHTFAIVDSTTATGAHGTAVRLTPDAGICDACEHELLDPQDRRFRHVFISCTDCGPRWSMLDALPYDRMRTRMQQFAMCDQCAREYGDPASRRFHAESVCCPRCGPTLSAFRADGAALGTGDDAIAAAVQAIRDGGVVALHGIGGFHLAVDATNPDAVARLRTRKQRPAKPFAVMVRTLDDARTRVTLDDVSADLLCCAKRPVVIAAQGASATAARTGRVADNVAPGLRELGIMLPSTAVQHLLLHDAGVPLVMTSGNATGEPLAATPEDAWRDLAAIADVLLMHDRPVVAPTDDSVLRREPHGAVWLRRARGWSPARIALPVSASVPILGLGADLKATVALAQGPHAWLSPHLGDQAALAVQQRTAEAVARLVALSGVVPRVVACDAHPGYASTAMLARWCDDSGFAPWGHAEPPAVHRIQHHHAHVAAVLVEHGITRPVVALAFDGAGWGLDDTVWGGEVLVADCAHMERVGALSSAPLIGGDRAAREPWLAACGWLHGTVGAAYDAVTRNVPEAHIRVARRLAIHAGTRHTSSMGRLFDAAAAVLGVVSRNTYEGEAAARLEALAGREPLHAGRPFPLVTTADGVWRFDPRPALARLAEAHAQGVEIAVLAAAWHDDVIATAVASALRALEDHVSMRRMTPMVALCGGVFQNVRLLHGVRTKLERRGVRVLTACNLPPNDGAIAVGQVAIAATQRSNV